MMLLQNNEYCKEWYAKLWSLYTATNISRATFCIERQYGVIVLYNASSVFCFKSKFCSLILGEFYNALLKAQWLINSLRVMIPVRK